MLEFTKEMLISEALKLHPKAVEIFFKYNLGCVGCMVAAGESVEAGAKAHGVNPDDLINDLNTLAEG